MPFIGRDWRADGEQWTKTKVGSWERPRRISITTSPNNTNSSLSDIFNALDIATSVSNIRRFNYIAKVVQILFKEKLGELSGNAQRTLFQIIERMIDTVLKTGDNIALMQRMITQFQNSIHSAYPFYYYIGSEPLWRQHIEMLTQMKEKIKQVRSNLIIKVNEDNNSKTTFDYLPIEMQSAIIEKLDNGRDILNVGMINSNLYHVTQELIIWKQLCLYHFADPNSKNSIGNEKIFGFLKRQQKDLDMDNIDWKKVYFKLKRRHGLRDVYAEMIHQCQLCKSLFWPESDHACPYERHTPSSKPITPRKLVNMLI